MTADRRLWWAALLAVIAALLLPLLLVDVPPLLDYPNHLARSYVLAFGARDAVLSQIYAPRWAIIPNLATDLLLPPLLFVLPVHVAGRIVIGLAALLPVFGTIAYSRAVFGVRSYWPLASSLVAYNATLLLGFINFALGVGLALLLAAAWIAWRDSYPVRVVVLTSIGTVVLFFCHLTGLLFCYLAIGTYEIGRLRLATIVRRAVVALPIVVVPAALYLASPFGRMPAEPVWASPHDKLLHGFAPLVNYWLWLDCMTATILAVIVVVGVLARWWSVRLCSGLALAVLCVGFLAAPTAFAGTFDVDTRFAAMAGFLLFGGILPAVMPRRIGFAVAALLVALFAVRTAVLAAVWHGHQHELDAFRTVVAGVAPGDRVLVAAVSPEEAPGYWQHGPRSRILSTGVRLDTHLPALLLIEHRAFWPFLFDNPSQQPIATRAPYRDLALRAEALHDAHWVAAAPAAAFCGYDYLLLLNAGGMGDPARLAPERLRLLTASDTAALYRIGPLGSACSG